MIPFFDESLVRRLLEQRAKPDKLNVVFTQNEDEDEIFEKEMLKVFLKKFNDRKDTKGPPGMFRFFFTASILDYLIDSTTLTHDYSERETTEENEIYLFASKRPFCFANYQILLDKADPSSALFGYWFSQKEST